MRSADFRRLVESLKVAIAIADEKGTIVFANVTFAEIAGRDDRGLAGVSLAALFSAGDRKRIQQNVARVGEGKAASATFEAKVASAEGERWVQVVMQPALDAREQAKGVIAVLHDIGAQRDTEQALYVLTARLLALAEASPVAAMIENADGDIEMVNEAFIRLVGMESAPQSLMGLSAHEMLKRSAAIDPKALEKAFGKTRGNSWGKGDVQSYRALKAPWKGEPTWPPSVAFGEGGKEIYVSWNGATEVKDWKLQQAEESACPDEAWQDVTTTSKQGFETEIQLKDAEERFLRVVALDADGNVLGVSDYLDLGWEIGANGILNGYKVSEYSAVQLAMFAICGLMLFVIGYEGFRQFKNWRETRWLGYEKVRLHSDASSLA